MKATGVVRRLDDLGRLVIPKEIRKIYHLKEGDSIEFFVNDNNEVILRKYQHFHEDNKQVTMMLETFHAMFKTSVFFYGDDQLLARGLEQGKKLFGDTVDKVKLYHETVVNSVTLFEGDSNLTSILVIPLVLDSHWVGSFILSQDINNESAKQVLRSFSKLLGQSMEK